MIFGMKITTKALLPIALLFAVIISMVLSWFIWTNKPARYERNKQDTVTSTGTQRDLSTKSIRDIYLPVQVIRTDGQGNQKLVNNRKVNLVTEIRDEMSKWQASSVREISSKSKSEYLRQLQTANTVLLNYDSNITVKIFNKVFNNQLKRIHNLQFNRIQFKSNDAKHVYLLNDTNFRIYRVNVKGQKLKELKKVLSKNLVSDPVEFRMLKSKPTVFITKAMTMPRYSYMINKQDENNFVNRLMSNDSNSTDISIKKRKNVTTYDDGAYHRMEVNKKTGFVTYGDYSSMTPIKSYTKRLTQSYNDLKKIGIPMDNTRFYYYNKDTSSVAYRGFVEGFPIFNQAEYGTARIQLVGDSIRQYNFSIYSLQVPVPSREKAKDIPTTQSMLDQLKAAGIDTNEISAVQLGYQWKQNKVSEEVIDLTPTWYIRYQGSWQTYESLLNS